jgi:hypothetical protein
MILSQQMIAYRLGVTIDLIGEELDASPAANMERMRGLLCLARADAQALQEGQQGPAVDDGPGERAKRPALRVLRGGRVD